MNCTMPAWRNQSTAHLDSHDEVIAIWPHTGAILVGGRSSRMGEPKHAMALPDGRTMMDAVGDAMRSVCRRVVVVGQTNFVRTRGYVEIADLRPTAGPLGGIEALLASSVDSQYLICPCDMPLMTADLLTQLISDSSALAMAFAFADDPAPIPLPMRLCADALPMVRWLLDSDQQAVHQLLREISADLVRVPRSAAVELQNVNTPAEFSEVCRLFHCRPAQS